MFFSKTGILGINARNLLYLRPYNKEKNIELADNKLRTKAFLSARGIPVPKLLGSINNLQELEKFNFKKLNGEFVLKPNLGYGGEGIIPILKREKSRFYGTQGQVYHLDLLKSHVQEILNGSFAISGHQDKAFFEQLIVTDDILGKFSYKGLPDIRVIVHNLVPVMAMLRLPTKESQGKANLHQGAIGAGIDLAKGEITYLSYKNNIIKEVPEFGSIKGVKIPYWDEILKMACQAQLATNLGYLGADIAIDKIQGPVLLEINARAGIGIQIANMQPLRKRLEKLEGISVTSISKGIRLAKDMFGYALEKDIKNLTGKKVIGIYEKVDVMSNDGPHESLAFINTSKKRSTISPDLAKNLGLIKSKRLKKDHDYKFQLKIKLSGRKIKTIFKVDPSIKKKYQIVIGNRDISGNFLVDPSINNLLTIKNTSTKSSNIFISNYSSLETDRQICKLSGQLKLLNYLRPLNFKEETFRFRLDKNYNPYFIYKDFEDEYQYFKKNLKNIRYDDSDLGTLFKKKIEEMELYIELIRARGSEEFYQLSSDLFGKPSPNDIEILKKSPWERPIQLKQKKYNTLETRQIFQQVLAEYGLKDWRVIIKSNILAKCMTNRNKKIILKSNSIFTEERLKGLIVHEIETHLLTAENGSRQKYKLFNIGFAGYLETQEGLAMHNVLTQNDPNNEEGHKETLTEAIFLADKMSFSELYEHIKAKKISERSAIDICLRVKRGLSDTSKPGAFTKDFCYFTGKQQVSNYLKDGGKIEDLYFGKYNLNDLSLIKSISSFERPPILPKWLKEG